MAGTPSRAPAAAPNPSSTEPIVAPTMIATRVSQSGRPGRNTKTAATGNSRLMPRFPHRPRVSRKPRLRFGGSLKVSGASPPGTTNASAGDDGDGDDGDDGDVDVVMR